MEELNSSNIEQQQEPYEMHLHLTRTNLFVRQILWKLPYEDLVDILSSARKDN